LPCYDSGGSFVTCTLTPNTPYTFSALEYAAAPTPANNDVAYFVTPAS
jgi:hypothetical protein